MEPMKPSHLSFSSTDDVKHVVPAHLLAVRSSVRSRTLLVRPGEREYVAEYNDASWPIDRATYNMIAQALVPATILDNR
jgi:hypothetical protein